MIRISLQNGAIGEFFCDTPTEAAEVVALIGGEKTTEKKVGRPIGSNKSAKPSQKGRMSNRWMAEEVQEIVKNLRNGMTTRAIGRSKELRGRHSRLAIENAVYSIRAGNYFSPRLERLVKEGGMPVSPAMSMSHAAKNPVEA